MAAPANAVPTKDRRVNIAHSLRSSPTGGMLWTGVAMGKTLVLLISLALSCTVSAQSRGGGFHGGGGHVATSGHYGGGYHGGGYYGGGHYGGGYRGGYYGGYRGGYYGGRYGGYYGYRGYYPYWGGLNFGFGWPYYGYGWPYYGYGYYGYPYYPYYYPYSYNYYADPPAPAPAPTVTNKSTTPSAPSAWVGDGKWHKFSEVSGN